MVHLWTHRDCGRIHKACTHSSQIGSQCWGKGRHEFPSLTMKISSTDIYLQRKKIVFSNGVLLGIQTTPNGQMANIKWIRRYFVDIWLIVFCLALFILLFVVVVVLLIYYSFQLRVFMGFLCVCSLYIFVLKKILVCFFVCLSVCFLKRWKGWGA